MFSADVLSKMDFKIVFALHPLLAADVRFVEVSLAFAQVPHERPPSRESSDACPATIGFRRRKEMILLDMVSMNYTPLL